MQLSSLNERIIAAPDQPLERATTTVRGPSAIFPFNAETLQRNTTCAFLFTEHVCQLDRHSRIRKRCPTQLDSFAESSFDYEMAFGVMAEHMPLTRFIMTVAQPPNNCLAQLMAHKLASLKCTISSQLFRCIAGGTISSTRCS